MTSEALTEQFLQAFPEYDPISKAPSRSDIEKRALETHENEQLLFRRESEKRYKALGANGAVYLVQNPAVWEYKDQSGSRTYYLHKPEFIGTVKTARTQSRGGWKQAL